MQEGDLTVTVTPLGDAFSSVGPPVTFSGLSLLEQRTDSVAYQLAPGNHVADTLRYVLTSAMACILFPTRSKRYTVIRIPSFG
jgi:hypothetical protein